MKSNTLQVKRRAISDDKPKCKTGKKNLKPRIPAKHQKETA